MAIPKLKVYRLNQDYNPLNDTDMQYLSDDELLPISSKNLNPLTVQEMVGVRERRDARMVVESEWKIIEFQMDITKQSMNAIETLTKECDNWVLGKGNFRVFVKKVKMTDYNSSDESNSSESVNLFDVCCTENFWYQVDRKFWDYEINTVKKYYYKNDDGKLVSTDNPTSFTIEQIHQIDEIYFKLGNMFLYSDFFNGGYESYLPIIGDESENKIIVMYKTFKELSAKDVFYRDGDEAKKISLNNLHQIKNSSEQVTTYLDSSYSKFRVPFGNIYNGNKQGRCFFNTDGTTSSVYDVTKVDNTKVQYYDGNYMYKKKILPLRCLIAQSVGYKDILLENGEIKEGCFVPDVTIDNDGTCTFKADYNWHVDGLMKPILMQRLTYYDDDGNPYKIFKKLQEHLQYTMIFQQLGVSGQDGFESQEIGFKISFLGDYYEINRSYYAYPKQVFLFYNTVDDSLGNLFDFNYDYKNFIVQKSIQAGQTLNTINVSAINPWEIDNNIHFKSYGYENRGNLILNDEYYKMFINEEQKKNLILYKKSQILAVTNGCGYDNRRDLLLEPINDNGVSKIMFTLPVVPSGEKYYNEHFTSELGYKIYINGKLIEDATKLKKEELSSSSSQTQEELSSSSSLTQNDFQISFNEDTNTWTIKRINTDIDFPKDLMLVFYERYQIGFNAEEYQTGSNEKTYKNPWCIGYRIPCYEKVKSANLFVSSFPNWVKGHLNNDLDIFVGNKEYSGTTLDEKNIQAIYPCYVNEGWYAMYPQGSVQFADYQDEYDYFDVFNYGTQMGTVKVETNEWTNIINEVLPNYLNTDSVTGIKAAYKIFYNKVKYNVAYYDGIYSVVRSRLSNYSIQNGGSYYALLQDDDFKESIGKRWVLRDDNYIRFLYESGLTQLPEVISHNENASVLNDVNARDGQFVRVDLKSNRISVINFNSLHASGFNDSMIVCLNLNSNKTEVIESNLITNQDIRVHVRIYDYKLWFGLEHDKSCNIFEGLFDEGTSTEINNSSGSVVMCNCNKQERVDDNYQTNFFGLQNIKWYCLQPLNDYYDELDINEVQTNIQNVGEQINSEDKILKRYKYHNRDWNFDVYFEIFSYRYSQDKDSSGKFPIESVEYIVYKVDK